MKNKGMLFILFILFLIAATGAGVGFYYNNIGINQKPIEIPKGKVVYKYYLEDIEVTEMPKNKTISKENNNDNTDGIDLENETDINETEKSETEEVTQEILYKFLKFSCTNDLTGTFDEEKWEFIPAEEKDSTCSLYFVNSRYPVTLTVINGTADESNSKYVDREENGTFKINPHEGYEFKDAICSDNKEAVWNSTNNTLLISAVTKEVSCKVNFSIQTLTAKITVVNGTGNTSENVEYGESVEAVVEAKDGYEKPKIECTNKQSATFENNKLTIAKLTKNTECKVTFTAVPVIKYKLTVSLPPQVKSVGNPLSQEIESGKDGSFTLRTDEEWTSKIDCGGFIPNEERLDSYTVKYTFLSMSKDIACKVTATNPAAIQTSPSEE